jgi:hypothetical protein
MTPIQHSAAVSNVAIAAASIGSVAPEHHSRFLDILAAILKGIQIAAAATPIVVGTLQATGKIDAQDAALASGLATDAGAVVAASTEV